MTDTSDGFKIDILPLKARPSRIKMTPEEMVKFNLEHGRKFMEGDIEGIMRESLVDDPIYEWYPNRIRASGQVAVRRYHELNYKIIIEQVDPRHGGDTREFYSSTCGENVICHEFSSMFNINGIEKRGYINAVIPFQDGKMIGERIYMDQDLAEFFENGLDEDFFRLSGVERF